MDGLMQLVDIVKQSKYLVFFGGAGVSTESNIPDFRSEKGLYKAQSQYGFSPEEMLSATFFWKHQEVFYDYYRKHILHPDAKPNPAHIGLAKLEKRGILKAVITQNIDGLHQKAGSQEVLELHGSVYTNHCHNCHAAYDMNYVEKSNNIPLCLQCGGVIKPDVVLYEEPLNHDVIERSVSHIRNADTLIIGGTSLVVYPAAGLIQYFRGKNLILINKTITPYDNKGTLLINHAIGEVFTALMEKLD